MDKDAVVHICNGILLSHKKECTWVSSNDVDEPRAPYTEWSKSEREKQISYINACIWNLERWYWWTYLQGSSGDRDIENRLWTWAVLAGRKEKVGQVERVAWKHIHSVQFSSVAQSCPALWDPVNRSTPGLPVHHQLPESIQTHVHGVGDAFQPSHPLSSPSPPAINLSQNQGLLKWVSSSHEVAKVLEFQLQHQCFQWTPRTDLL